MKLYKYTILEQGGGIKELEPCKKKEFKGKDGLYELLNCQTIEIIPNDYFKNNKWNYVTCYGDGEARFNSNNYRNPHFEPIVDLDGNIWDVVGNIIREEVTK